MNNFNWVDFAVVIIVAVMLGLIIYFHFIRNHSHKKVCSSCPEGKRGEHLVEDYFRMKKKETEKNKNNNSCSCTPDAENSKTEKK